VQSNLGEIVLRDKLIIHYRGMLAMGLQPEMLDEGADCVCVCIFVIYIEFFPYCLFVSNSQVIGCEDRLQNDLYCVGWGVELCSVQSRGRCQRARSMGRGPHWEWGLGRNTAPSPGKNANYMQKRLRLVHVLSQIVHFCYI